MKPASFREANYRSYRVEITGPIELFALVKMLEELGEAGAIETLRIIEVTNEIEIARDFIKNNLDK